MGMVQTAIAPPLVAACNTDTDKKRILFVDDEPNVMEGLRRMLRKHRGVWDVDFAGGGKEALVKMESAPFDVVVTDLQMPGMSGAELLEQVMQRHPDTVRIVLSGQASGVATTRAMWVAHQFLSKPTDAETLKSAITRAVGMQGIIANDRIRAVVASCESLPSLPSLYVELSQALKSETSDSKTISRLVCRDVALSAKLLQLINSSFFGLGRRISSIEQAVSLLGVIRLKAMVLTEHVVRQFETPLNQADFSSTAFWAHSLRVGEIARQITKAEEQGGDRPDQAFTAGLLHDVGKLVLASQHTEVFKEIMEKARTERRPLCDVEMDLICATHAEIGAYLLGLWGLPPRIVEAVALHHHPGTVPYDGVCAVTVVHAANVFVSVLGSLAENPGDDPLVLPLDHEYMERIGVTGRVAAWQKLAKEVWDQTADKG